jgi:hypothetical protein
MVRKAPKRHIESIKDMKNLKLSVGEFTAYVSQVKNENVPTNVRIKKVGGLVIQIPIPVREFVQMVMLDGRIMHRPKNELDREMKRRVDEEHREKVERQRKHEEERNTWDLSKFPEFPIKYEKMQEMRDLVESKEYQRMSNKKKKEKKEEVRKHIAERVLEIPKRWVPVPAIVYKKESTWLTTKTVKNLDGLYGKKRNGKWYLPNQKVIENVSPKTEETAYIKVLQDILSTDFLESEEVDELFSEITFQRNEDGTMEIHRCLDVQSEEQLNVLEKEKTFRHIKIEAREELRQSLYDADMSPIPPPKGTNIFPFKDETPISWFDCDM